MEKINDDASASSFKFTKGQNVLCYYQTMIYEAKCLKLCMVNGVPNYLVHYKGWNNHWDEWVDEDKLLVINKVNLDHMETVNKEQLKIIKEKRSKTKNKRKIDVIPSTSNSTISKKKKSGQPPNISKTSTSKKLKPPSASNKNVLLDYELSLKTSVVIDRLTDEQIKEMTKKKTNTKTHKIITEKCDSIEINPTKKCDKSSQTEFTNTNGTNYYINTIKSIDLCEKTSEFVGTSEVARSINAETSDNVNKNLNTMNIEPDKSFPVWKQTTGSSCEIDKDDKLDAFQVCCKNCGSLNIVKLEVKSFKVIKVNEIVNNSNTNLINFDIAQNKCNESEPLATENKNTTEFGLIENIETTKGKMSETKTIQVDELLENFPEDTTQNKNTLLKEIMPEIKNTLGVSVIENLETSISNLSEIETIEGHVLYECPEDISTFNTKPKDVTKSKRCAKNWSTFEKEYYNKTK